MERALLWVSWKSFWCLAVCSLIPLATQSNSTLLYYCLVESFWWRILFKRYTKRMLFGVWYILICVTVSWMGVSRASAIFVGVYEPVKHKLLDSFPDHLSAVAHLVIPITCTILSRFVNLDTSGRVRNGPISVCRQQELLEVQQLHSFVYQPRWGEFLILKCPLRPVWIS